MKTKIVVESVLITNRKNIKQFLDAIEMTGVKINLSGVGDIMKMSASTVFDSWKRIERDNDLEAVLTIRPKSLPQGLSVAQEAPFLASKPLKGSIPRLKQQSLKSVRKGLKSVILYLFTVNQG